MSDDFFGDLGRSITRATQKAASRTGSLIESTKINAMVSAEEKAIEGYMKEIGETIYARCVSGEMKTDELLAPIVDEISARQEKIRSYRAELASLRGMTVCPSCGEIIETDSLFCPKCGTATPGGEQEVAEVTEPQDAGDADAAEEPALEEEPAETDAADAEAAPEEEA